MPDKEENLPRVESSSVFLIVALLPEKLAVFFDENGFFYFRWPISTLEFVTEATNTVTTKLMAHLCEHTNFAA